MIPRFSPAPALLGVAALLCGCAMGSQEFGRVIDHRDIAAIQVGVSNKQDVLDLFGPPSSFSQVGAALEEERAAGGGGEVHRVREDVFTYEFRQENETFFTVILYTSFHRTTRADRLMVFFDEDDVVKYVAFAKETDVLPEEMEAEEECDDDDDDDEDPDDDE